MMEEVKNLRDIPNEMVSSLKLAQKRFLFNVDVIEQKYCQKSSGLVYDVNKDKFVFDSELCNVDNDDSLLKTIARQQKSHFETEFGSSIICSPSAAPEDNIKAETRIKKLNKLFQAMHEEN